MLPAHDLRVTYIGGPTLLIEIGGLRLLTDPTFDAPRSYDGAFYSKTTGPAVRPEDIGRIDAVLLSHDHHLDNFDQAGRALLTEAGIVLTTVAGAERLGGRVVGLADGQAHILSTPGGQLTVTGTPARHGPEGNDRGPVTGFLLEADALAQPVWISGDTVWYGGVERTLLSHPDIGVAVLFVGAASVPVVDGHLTFTAAEAVQVAKALPGAVIVPVHFEGWTHIHESKVDMQAAFAAAGIEDRLRWLEAGRATTLRGSGL